MKSLPRFTASADALQVPNCDASPPPCRPSPCGSVDSVFSANHPGHKGLGDTISELVLGTVAVLAVAYWLTGTDLLAFQAASGVRGSASAPVASKERSADAPGPELPEAKSALDQARQRLNEYESIKAKLVETVALTDRKFTVNGNYLQSSGADLKLRLEFQVKLGDTEGSLLEVCDGRVLWTRHDISGNVRITRRDVRQILKEAGEGHGTPADNITVELGFGGLPGLLASIEKSMQFDRVKEDAADGRKLVVIEGGWKAAMLKVWQGNNPKAPLPNYVPSRIRVYLDAESLFPRRILYLGRNGEQALRPMVSLDFTEVETNVPIPAGKFKFVPPDGVFPEDLTPQFLDQIKQRRLQGGQ